MRIHVDLASHVSGTPAIVQADKTPAPNTGQAGALTAISGKYVIPLPPGIDLPLSSSSYVLTAGGERDGGDVTSIAFSQLLALYPQYGHVYSNPLLTSKNVDELNLTATYLDASYSPPVAFPTRCQTGRGGVTQNGQMPTHTAVYAMNTTITTMTNTGGGTTAVPGRPGVLITNDIDLTSFIPSFETGFQEFLVYWRLQGFSTTQDILSNYGLYAGTNTNQAAVRYLSEVEQAPTGFSVYLSGDSGAHWCQVTLLQPVALGSQVTKVRLAFVNRGSSPVYLAQYAILF